MGGRGGAKAAPGPRSPANGVGCTRGAHWSSLDHGARQLMHAPVPRSRPLSPSIPHAPSRLLGGWWAPPAEDAPEAANGGDLYPINQLSQAGEVLRYE